MVSFGHPPRVPVNSSPGNSPGSEVGIPDGIEILKYWFLGRRYTHRLRVVPHFYSGIIERAKRERA